MKKFILKESALNTTSLSLNEGSNTGIILSAVDKIQDTIKALKADKTLPKSETDKLFTLAGPLVKALLKLVD